jgi:GR25 family glycosyltransferase involved in LPS biosynthesis
MNEILNAPAFVIHLESLKARKDFFTKNITDAGFTDMRIFKGVDARINSEFEEAKQLFGNPLISSEPSKGSMGCVFSHFKVLKHIIDNQIPVATVFEDDVHFHPQWKELAPEYLSKTPKDFDVIFIGNGLDSCRFSPNPLKITTESCFCTHAYIVTLEGAKKLLNTMLYWRHDLFHHPSHKVEGLYIVDVMIKHMQNLINSRAIKRTFTWYCWNGTIYECKSNKIPLQGNDVRNTGLVFQATDDFETTLFLD